MRNFNRIILVFALFSASVGCGQSLKMILANKAYESMQYAKACEYYTEILAKDGNNQQVLHALANSYLKMNEMAKAERVLWKIYKINGVKDTTALLSLSVVLAENGKYESSDRLYEKYLEATHKSHSLFLNKKHIDLSDFYKDTASIRLKECKFNSRQSDFSPTPFKNGIVFSSSRITDSSPSEEEINSWDNSAYLDLYFVDTTGSRLLHNSYFNIEKKAKLIDEEDELEEEPKAVVIKNKMTVIPLPKRLNSKYHEGPCSFVGDTIIYFTRNNYDGLFSKKSDNKAVNLDIFMSRLINGTWSKPEILPFCNRNYSVGHPTISKDGNTMYFVSNMPGGYGGTDIYSVKKRNGHWEIPQNMGSKINTEADEKFPFVDYKNILYFASNGHKGLGGLDIYKYNLHDQNASPTNLGYPINRKDDDFGLIINKNGQSGYLSSNRKRRGNDDDIYFFTYNVKDVPKIQVSIKSAKDSSILAYADIELIEKHSGNIKSKMALDRNGFFEYQLAEMGNNYDLFLSKPGYINQKVEISATAMAKRENPVYDTTVYLQESKPVICTGFVIDNQSKLPISHTQIYFFNTDQQSVDSVRTDEKGKFSRKITSNMNYLIKAVNDNYFSQCNKIDIPQTADSNYLINNLHFSLTKISTNSTFEIQNLMYDYRSTEIKPEAELIIDNLITEILDAHPTIKIEIGAHTDSRGDDQFNLKLSQKRADGVVAYLTQKGVSPHRITAKGYGESKPLNRCKNGVECLESEHFRNRRIEIKVTGFLDSVQPDNLHAYSPYKNYFYNETSSNACSDFQFQTKK